MSIDKQKLRQCIEQVARQTSAPWFTTEELARQLRRRRTRAITAVTDALIAAAAVAVAIPVALRATSLLPTARRLPRAPRLAYTIIVKGETQELPARGSAPPRIVVSPGEDLSLTVDVTVPEHVTVTDLWLGITDGVLSGHANMSPLLAASTDTTLNPGAHRFTLRWVVPADLRPGAGRQLSAQWAWPGQVPGAAQRIIAELEVQASPGT
jgi:hypothetical protein